MLIELLLSDKLLSSNFSTQNPLQVKLGAPSSRYKQTTTPGLNRLYHERGTKSYATI